jgi:hypothetical protein
MQYVLIEEGDDQFAFRVRPNPETVEMTEGDIVHEDAMRFGNSISRARRQAAFRRRMNQGSTLPVLVSEGDSWFQFPLAVQDVVDHLNSHFLIWSLGAAGDTLQNITDASNPRDLSYEYMPALRALRAHVKGFLFSAAGNDIIGEFLQPDGTRGRALQRILKNPGTGTSDPAAYVDEAELAARLAGISAGYAKVIADIRGEPGFETLPIFVHGYDYVFPHEWQGEGSRRKQLWANPPGRWLGAAFSTHGISDEAVRRAVMVMLIDRLYAALELVAGDPAHSRVHVVDCRGAMPDVGDWIDEIHGRNPGFARVAERFRVAIEAAI